MRLFDADALRAVLIPLEQKYAGAYADLGAALGCIVQQLDRFPAVDAVNVTRCKDCKYVIFTEHRDYIRCTKHCAFSFRPNDFCSYGERMEGGDDNVSD